MLADAKLPTYFWAEAVNTACFIQNCTLVNMHGKTPYEMIKGKKPSVKHFHIFGCKCYVLKVHPEQLGKFEAKSDEAIFLGYSTTKAFKVYNLRTHIIMESIHVAFDDKKIEGLDNEQSHDKLEFENFKDSEIYSSDEESSPVIDSTPSQRDATAEGEQNQENEQNTSHEETGNSESSQSGSNPSESTPSGSSSSWTSGSGSVDLNDSTDLGGAFEESTYSSTQNATNLGESLAGAIYLQLEDGQRIILKI